MEINGLDLIDVTSAIRRRLNRYLALLLKDLEDIITDRCEYNAVRKLVLDCFNDYTRSVFRVVLGDDVEGLSFR